jgi:hypothetical protein
MALRRVAGGVLAMGWGPQVMGRPMQAQMLPPLPNVSRVMVRSGGR